MANTYVREDSYTLDSNFILRNAYITLIIIFHFFSTQIFLRDCMKSVVMRIQIRDTRYFHKLFDAEPMETVI